MIAEACNRAWQVIQGPAKVSRHRVGRVSGEVHLDPSAAALDFNPYAIALAGDNRRRVHEKREILHDVTPSLIELELYASGATERVLQVKKLVRELALRSLSEVLAAQLLLQRDCCVRREAEFLANPSAVEAYPNHVFITGDNGRGGNKFTSHTNKLLRPLAFLVPARDGNASEGVEGAQLTVRIIVFSRNTALKLAGLQLHLIGHSDELCGVHPKASGPANTVVTLSAALARRHLNHSHKSASYSYAHHGELAAGVTPEANENKEGML